MKANLLMNCLWYEDIAPEQIADVLEITPEQLFRKIFQKEDFTLEEIKKIGDLLALTDEEKNTIFFS